MAAETTSDRRTAALRFGILSTASILKHFVPAVRSLGADVATVVAVASRTQAAADACATQYGIPTALASYEALLNHPDIDVVYVPLPPNLHREWVIKALQAGKHVLVEKPIALVEADVVAMQTEAATRGLVLMEAYMSLYTAQHRRLLELVDGAAGASDTHNSATNVLGQLLSIRARFGYTLSRKGFREAASEDGGGSLWDVGCYAVTFGLSLLQRALPPSLRTALSADDFVVSAVASRSAVVAVSAANSSASTTKGADMAFYGTLVHKPTGVAISIESALAGPLRADADVVGTDGRLALAAPFKPDSKGANIAAFAVDGSQMSTETVVDSSPSDGSPSHLYAGELRAFFDLVYRARGEGPVTLDGAYALSRVAVALLAKLHSTSVDVPFHQPAARL